MGRRCGGDSENRRGRRKPISRRTITTITTTRHVASRARVLRRERPNRTAAAMRSAVRGDGGAVNAVAALVRGVRTPRRPGRAFLNVIGGTFGRNTKRVRSGKVEEK